LQNHPVVTQAVREAFERAKKYSENTREGFIEHGGWILWKVGSVNTLLAVHKPPRTMGNTPPGVTKNLDGSTNVYLSGQYNGPPEPPPGWVYVATFHIHPEDRLDTADMGDVPASDSQGVPGIVGLPNGEIHVVGNLDRGIFGGSLPPGCR
jgi:hypothetical protein